MTTFLYNLLTAGSDKMAVTDPAGWTLTFVSVTVVFAALIILYFIYQMIGNFSSGKWSLKKIFKSSRKKAAMNAETAAAIAMAIERYSGSDEVPAAIAAAIHLYISETVHDVEPGIITIRRTPGNWDDKTLGFRRKPNR